MNSIRDFGAIQILALTLYVMGTIADLWTTKTGLDAGIPLSAERNRFSRWMIRQWNIYGATLLPEAIIGTVLVLWTPPSVMVYGLFAGGIAQLAASYNNYKVVERWKDARSR